ncbi:MAG: toast rack family protein [Candidatus Neomarinimicrobiota bacterium]
MKRILRYSPLLLCLSVALAWPRPEPGRRNPDERTILTIDEALADNVERMEVNVEFGLGEIRVERGNPAKAVTGYIQYDEDYISPKVEYEVKGNVARFQLTTKSQHRGWEGISMRDMDSPESELYFTTRVPLEVDFSCGLGEANLDLGYLKVMDLKLDNGLGETTLDFSTPNGVELRRIDVDNGLGELVAHNLANAKTERLKFDCGLGSAELDFSGETLKDMSVDVNVGLGSVTLRIPRGYNVEMEAEENFLSTIDTNDMVKKGRGLYRSENYDPSRPTLRITASVGLGSIDINWTD